MPPNASQNNRGVKNNVNVKANAELKAIINDIKTIANSIFDSLESQETDNLVEFMNKLNEAKDKFYRIVDEQQYGATEEDEQTVFDIYEEVVNTLKDYDRQYSNNSSKNNSPKNNSPKNNSPKNNSPKNNSPKNNSNIHTRLAASSAVPSIRNTNQKRIDEANVIYMLNTDAPWYDVLGVEESASEKEIKDKIKSLRLMFSQESLGPFDKSVLDKYSKVMQMINAAIDDYRKERKEREKQKEKNKKTRKVRKSRKNK
jgi:hypothetical protein